MATAHGVAESRQQALINSISIPLAFVGQPVSLKMLTAFKKTHVRAAKVMWLCHGFDCEISSVPTFSHQGFVS
jgi:hypothetical protein